MGFLTEDAIDVSQLYVQAVILAKIVLINPDLFPPDEGSFPHIIDGCKERCKLQPRL